MHDKSKKKIIFIYYILTFTIPLSSSPSLIKWLNYLNLLSQSNEIFTVLDENDYCYTPCNCIQKNNCITLDAACFFHPRIKTCIYAMQESQSLKPLLQLSRSFEKYLYVHNIEFVRELCILFFIIHKQIILRTCAERPQIFKTIDLEKILEISEKINQLPIAEVLNAIDMLVTELPPFLEKYEFNSKISWQQWLKKYWWVPPIFGGWFGLKILLRLQRPHYYFSPYLSSRPTIPLPPIITNDPALQEIIVQTKK